MKLALDAGHYINTPGKRTPDGIREWTLNDRVLRGFETEIKKYKNVQVVRLDDPTGKNEVILTRRTKKANAENADYLISFHHNAYQGTWGDHGGTETWIQKAGGKDEVLAKVLNDAIVGTLGLRNRGVKVGNMHMNRESKAVSCLVEVGFMDSTTDKIIRDEHKSREVGKNMAIAFAEHYGLSAGATEKPTATKKPNEVVAKEVLNGDWGNGSARKQRLTKAGYDYTAVQAVVNAQSKPKPTEQKPEYVIVQGSHTLYRNASGKEHYGTKNQDLRRRNMKVLKRANGRVQVSTEGHKGDNGKPSFDVPSFWIEM